MQRFGHNYWILPVVFLLCTAITANAQRTAIGTYYGSLQANCSFSGIGADLSAGTYTATGLWKITVSDANRTVRVVGGGEGEEGKYHGSIGCMHILAKGDYLWRIVNNHSRTLNFYGGAGLFLGMELLDPAHTWPKDSVFPFDGRNSFLYGLEAQLEFEWFFLRSVPDLAIVFDGSLPFNFSSKISKFNQEVSLGLRYNF